MEPTVSGATQEEYEKVTVDKVPMSTDSDYFTLEGLMSMLEEFGMTAVIIDENFEFPESSDGDVNDDTLQYDDESADPWHEFE